MATLASTVPRRVLIVDDNSDLAENIAEILQLDGHTTETASSAEEAYPKAMATAPDVVVTDYRLPGANGAAFVKHFLKDHTRVLAVVISAYTDDHTIEEARQAGATFIPKPVDFRFLSRLIAERHGTA